MRKTAVSSCLLAWLLLGPLAMASPGTAPPPTAGELDWSGDPGLARPASGPTLAVVGKDDLVRYVPGGDRRPARLQRVRLHRDIVWDLSIPAEFVDAAALMVDVGSGGVYLAHYSAIASGATLRAFDLGSGAARWTTPVHGLGPVEHSKYANQVRLQMLRGALVVFGNESAGRYIEVFDPGSGRMLSTRTLPAGGATAATAGPGPEPCRSRSDLERLSGRRAVVIGTYHEIDVRMRAAAGAPVYRGHAALRLADGTEVLLEPSWSRAAVRSQPERNQFAGKQVEVSGTVHARSPASSEHPAQLINPCVSPVEQVRLAQTAAAVPETPRRGLPRLQAAGDAIVRIGAATLPAGQSDAELAAALTGGRWWYRNPHKKTSTWESQFYTFFASGEVERVTNDLGGDVHLRLSWRRAPGVDGFGLLLGDRRLSLEPCQDGDTATLCLFDRRR